MPRPAGAGRVPDRFLSLAALLFGAWMTFHHLGDFPLLSPDEGRNAEVAREMLESGSWLVPTYDGATYLDKPAFFFRTVALSLGAFGTTEFAARLPSALFAFGLLVMLWGFCRQVYDRLTAAIAVVVVASTPLFMAFARIVIFDMTLAFCVCAAILSAFLAETREDPAGRRRWYLTATAMAGLGTLVKGPVGFLVPLLVMTTYHGTSGNWRAIRRFFAPVHVGLFLAVVLPWFAGLSLACPDFPYYGIMKESIARFTTTEFRRTQPFYYYGLIIAGGFFAWSMLLPASLPMAWRERRQLDAADRLFVIWALVVVVFFSLSQSKLPGYILTGVIALGVLVARVLGEALTGNEAARRLVRNACAGLALAALLLSAPALLLAYAPTSWPATLTPKPEFLQHFGDLLPGLAISLITVALLAGVAWARDHVRLAMLAFLATPLWLITLQFDWIPRHAGIKSAREIAANLPRQLPADTEFACLGCMPHGLPFYLGKPITVFTEDGHELTSNYVLFSLASGKPWPERLIPSRQLAAYLASRAHPVYLLTRAHRRNELETLARPHGARLEHYRNDYIGTLLPATER